MKKGKIDTGKENRLKKIEELEGKIDCNIRFILGVTSMLSVNLRSDTEEVNETCAWVVDEANEKADKIISYVDEMRMLYEAHEKKAA